MRQIPGTGNCTSCWWTKAPMNWNVVSNGALTIGALAIVDVPRYADAATKVPLEKHFICCAKSKTESKMLTDLKR